ncbi:hypothetical protein [Tropicimonas sediminicola]|uniref:Glycosyl transferases group 1 n=1 Tax=Tropicimonas sediminicola TaxID=1031541 RepID=A0A239HAI0_9RHOB|nr:hypothetical protein [Tropicimonas sediminicola]SNS78135.1 hypothetical protein SAMN05421757_103312 [Tropicimonas sediminicola]
MAIQLIANMTPVAGWTPVLHMIGLMARCMGARLHQPSVARYSRAGRSLLPLLMPPRHGDGDIAIFVARTPAETLSLLTPRHRLASYRLRVLWLIDSFWVDRLPPTEKLDAYDVICFTRGGDRDFYESEFGKRALWLGWGSDVLDLGSANPERPVDVLRVGRQPPDWDNDVASGAACAAAGLRFAGRPPFGDTPETQQAQIMSAYSNAKFVIAHSNLAAPAPYVHPSVEYITARWTDALACGAVVAGSQPQGDLELVDWPGALLDFPRIDRAENVAQLAEAAAAWAPETARRNHLEALRRLDWRWRFEALAQRMGHYPPALAPEMTRLHSAIAAAEAGC